ncbi:hypothetical protein B0A48_12472 [Cryoendolithus antarcticus]|uniref:Protein kinase domain-containing protein n=1 Tax=Cryoendolithus antarcticus TaxID=1507870 RepID=A0A1V8SSG0_9PEZI|nr:hypothetical protein B0A48_12472 [Cryoendolithus antarcticus]
MTDKVVVTEERFTDVAHRLIGKGGEGEANLAIRYNHQTHQIVDRFVSKSAQRWLIDYILEAFYDAGLTLEFGACNGARDPDWEKILHRDIKPKNIFLAEPSDFGLAIFETDADHHDFYTEGSDGYLSPEQVVHSPIGDEDSSEDGSKYGSDLKRRQAELDGEDTK